MEPFDTPIGLVCERVITVLQKEFEGVHHADQIMALMAVASSTAVSTCRDMRTFPILKLALHALLEDQLTNMEATRAKSHRPPV